jgi:sensor histidine kinase regulating citrate/malate metabolism
MGRIRTRLGSLQKLLWTYVWRQDTSVRKAYEHTTDFDHLCLAIQSVFDHISSGIFILDTILHVKAINKAAQRMLGISTPEGFDILGSQTLAVQHSRSIAEILYARKTYNTDYLQEKNSTRH